MNTKYIIAIDGHSSCGKSTVAKQLAATLKIAYIDTGAMYRAVTLFGMRNGWVTGSGCDAASLTEHLGEANVTFAFNSATGGNDTLLNNENVECDIRGLEVSQHVSAVSAISAVRKYLVAMQREMAQTRSVVMDGRDIGTVVFPNADVKFFMTATAEVRARRRYEELLQKGQTVTYDEVLDNVNKRDLTDTTREDSPLKPAADAIVVDNTNLTPEQQFKLMLSVVKEKCNL